MKPKKDLNMSISDKLFVLASIFAASFIVLDFGLLMAGLIHHI